MTHVPWCMSGSLTCGDGENVPSIPGAWATHNFRIWQEGRYNTFEYDFDQIPTKTNAGHRSQFYPTKTCHISNPQTTCILWEFNALAPGSNDCNLKCVIFKHILMADIMNVSIEITHRYMLQDLIDDTPILVLCWCRQGASHYVNQCWPSLMTTSELENITTKPHLPITTQTHVINHPHPNFNVKTYRI